MVSAVPVILILLHQLQILYEGPMKSQLRIDSHTYQLIAIFIDILHATGDEAVCCIGPSGDSGNEALAY